MCTYVCLRCVSKVTDFMKLCMMFPIAQGCEREKNTKVKGFNLLQFVAANSILKDSGEGLSEQGS